MTAYNWRRWTQPESILRVLELGAGKNGRLWIAVTYRGAEDVLELLRRGADPLFRDEATDLTVFRQAALRGDLGIVHALAEAGALEAEIAENGGARALFAATVKGHKQVVSYLLEHGVEPSLRDEDGRTVLMKAIDCDKSAVAVWLAKQGGDPDATDRDGRTALHHACSRGKLGVVKALLKAGADPAARAENGDTPASLASEPKIQELLKS